MGRTRKYPKGTLMQLKTFKLSACACALASISTMTQAALYTIAPVNGISSTQTSKATAISPDGLQIAVENYLGPDGTNYSQELSFMVDMEHEINSYSSLDNYCIDYLGYNTCTTWVNEQWFGIQANGEVCDNVSAPQSCIGGMKKSIDAWNVPFVSNNIASINNTQINPFGAGVTGDKPLGTISPESTNVYVNEITDSGLIIGASSSPYYSQNGINARAFARRGFLYSASTNQGTELTPPNASTPLINAIGQTNAKGQITTGSINITFGSASVSNMADAGHGNKIPEGASVSSLDSCSSVANYSDRACQYFQFANQAAIWVSASVSASSHKAHVIDTFTDGPTGNGNQTAQASINAAAIIEGKTAPTLVGFTTRNETGEFHSVAVKYSPVTDFETCLSELQINASKRCWSRTAIPGIDIRQDGNFHYSYTTATDINDKDLVVGVAKSALESNGAFAETVFVNNSAGTTLLSRAQSPLFFQGYNATAAAINNNNELVGKIDIDQNRDRLRRQRGYIYLHENAPNLASFNQQRAWLLDDLTNDGVQSGIANKYRIAEAFDISESGDIAASAFYCSTGYSSIMQNATCSVLEELVAVKLTRQEGSVLPRQEETKEITRNGAGFGLFSLSFIALCGFVRRKKAMLFSARTHTFSSNKNIKP